ncbi:type III pantothenate kinase [Chromatiaceae bacterium AAb-1]|nr:type III pantothenate kinase [Chromatiaceae bacterium AAb-1]
MYLLIDIGNSRDKATLADKGKITPLPQLTAENVAKLPLQAVYFSSVASPERALQLRQKLELEHIPWRQVHSEPKAFGVTSSYQQSGLLGVDRWLLLLGSQLKYPSQTLMIVDAGTAVTVDWLAADGIHLGGWILPGLRLQQQAVVKNTAKVFNSEAIKARLEPGQETVACLQNGCLAAVTGAIQQGWQLGLADNVILTGGDSIYLKPHLSHLPLIADPLLLFYGLARYIDN